MGCYPRFLRLYWIGLLLLFEGMLLTFSLESPTLKTWVIVVGTVILMVAIQSRLIYIIMRERRENRRPFVEPKPPFRFDPPS